MDLPKAELQLGQQLPVVEASPLDRNAPVYAPLSLSEKQERARQAKVLRFSLTKWNSREAAIPNWPKLFWTEVEMLATKGMDPQLKALVATMGYTGPGCASMPRVEDFKRKLFEHEAAGMTVDVSIDGMVQQVDPDDGILVEDDMGNWHNHSTSK